MIKKNSKTNQKRLKQTKKNGKIVGDKTNKNHNKETNA